MKIDKEYARRVALDEFQKNTHDILEAYFRGFETAMKKAGLVAVDLNEYEAFLEWKKYTIKTAIKATDGE